MQDRALWKRLLEYRFDAPGASMPFSRKLAKEEGWSASRAAKVIEEYRKFLYLSQVSPGQASPSVAVDRAWHLHLTYTQDYWGDLCDNVLNKPLHHHPSNGAEEDGRFVDQYRQTRALYKTEFGRPPPKDVWPDLVAAGQSRGDTAFALILGGAILIAGSFAAQMLWPAMPLLAAGAGYMLGFLSMMLGFRMAAPGREKNAGCGGGCGGGADCGGGGCGGGD